MADDMLAAMLAALDRNDDEAPLKRTSDENHPLKPVPERPRRRTLRTYRDPTGEAAVGNVNKEQKKP